MSCSRIGNCYGEVSSLNVLNLWNKMKLVWITDAQIVEGYTLYLTFNDGCRKIFDVSSLLNDGNPLYLPLKDIGVFSDMELDGWTVTWNNGTIDIAPEFLYQEGIPID